jgi:Tol biopolymer transport system component/tRNA A-37 threonylcarbamoyl transferase component Bud32
MIGKTIAHYKIIEKLGEGGMGVVYKARDQKLDRLLALKFLPPHLTVNDTDKARFLQEAKAASSISHPNVCVIHDIQEYDDQQFIVMEYVDGITLRQLISDNDQISLKNAIEYALQISTALEEAHNKGVVHRDIKSENIMVSSKNQIKVMDFGLAKLKGSLKLTKTSSTVGTLAYMAPEVIEGKETDTRSDIFSFGVLLYEMLTGKLPFTGEYESALMYSIINDEPEPIEIFRRDLSSELVHVLNRSLEKDPEDRYQNMHDLLIDLKRVKRDSARVSRKSLKEMPLTDVHREVEKVESDIKPKRKSSNIVPLGIIAILALIIIILLIFNPFSEKSLPQMQTRPLGLSGDVLYPAFSPDGKKLAYSLQTEDKNDHDIYTQQIETGSRRSLTDHPGEDYSPVWSGDENYIAFIRDYEEKRSIHKMTSEGDQEELLITLNREPLSLRANLSWLPNQEFLAFSDLDSAQEVLSIYTFSLENFEKRRLTSPPKGYSDYNPVYSHDGKKLAFVRGPNYFFGDIWVLNLDGGEPEQITFNKAWIYGLTWTADSREIVFDSNLKGTQSLWQVKASGGSPKIVQRAAQNDIGWPAVSLIGQYLAYVSIIWNDYLWRMNLNNPKNSPERIPWSSGRGECEPQYSPSGDKIVISSFRSGPGQIWVCDSSGENLKQLTFIGTMSGSPIWSPKGQTIAFDSNLEGHIQIYTINVNGGNLKPITSGESNNHIPSWSIDGDSIYFRSDRSGEEQIWKTSAEGGESRQITSKGGQSAFESFDRKWIYYTKGEKGIWKKSMQGGEEQLVINHPVGYRSWDLMEEGIYYTYSTGSDYILAFYNFETGNNTEICKLGGELDIHICVSPEQKWLLYAKQEQRDSDIILFENFR